MTTKLASIKRFRARLREVDAIQYRSLGDAYDILDWIWYGDGRVSKGDAFPKFADDPRKRAGIEAGDRFWIKTLEGTMEVSPQDWVICGVNGEFYPCKPDVFEKSWEPVVGESQ